MGLIQKNNVTGTFNNDKNTTKWRCPMKKRIALILMLLLACQAVLALAETTAEGQVYAVVLENTEVRATAYSRGKILSRLEPGETLILLEEAYAKDGSLWYRVEMQGSEYGYVAADKLRLYTYHDNPEDALYIGNVRTHVFHFMGCHRLPAAGNQAFFTTREDAVREGYRPCGLCKP